MYELIHTSAPRGLFGGSGYTTVAATVGMPEALRKVLESLSGYEQIHDYGAPRFSANPVAFICQPIGQAAGKSWWVLSRVAVADKDYTGRSNYLAHHVALEQNELSQAGPAALAKVYPWTTTWTGEPRALAIRTVPAPNAFSETSSAPAWTSVGLDAGWAGHLAEQARSRRGLIQLVYPAGADPLALVADAVALLPPMERWDARFHTHTSRPRPELAWALFPADAGISTELVRRPGTVQLGLRPPCPGNGPLVERARGKLPPTPAAGGAGVRYFPGHGSHDAAGTAMLVATASESPLHGGEYPRPWDQIPVAKKKTSLGPILHWVGHVGLLAVCAILFLMMVLGVGGQKNKLDEAKVQPPVDEAKEIKKEDKPAVAEANQPPTSKLKTLTLKEIQDESISLDDKLKYEIDKEVATSLRESKKKEISYMNERDQLEFKLEYELKYELQKIQQTLREKDADIVEKKKDLEKINIEYTNLKNNIIQIVKEKDKEIYKGPAGQQSDSVSLLIALNKEQKEFMDIVQKSKISEEVKNEVCIRVAFKQFHKGYNQEIKQGKRDFKTFLFGNIESYCKASDGSEEEKKYIKTILFTGINEQLLGNLESQKIAWSAALNKNRKEFEDYKNSKINQTKKDGQKRLEKLEKLEHLLDSIMSNMNKIG
jgi:hypothetical protein